MPTIPLDIMVGGLGMILMTRSAANQLNRKDVIDCLERHMIGDYGDVDDVDWKSNNVARAYGFPVVSAYSDRKKNLFRIVTEPDRCLTTISLAEED
jgi:hypothetical protein